MSTAFFDHNKSEFQQPFGANCTNVLALALGAKDTIQFQQQSYTQLRA